MTTPSHADIQTGALPLPVLTVSRWSRVIALLVAITLIGGVACLQFGSERIPLGDVARILLSGGDETLTGASGVSRSVIVRVSSPPLSRMRATSPQDRKSTRLNSSHGSTSYAVFCLKKKN